MSTGKYFVSVVALGSAALIAYAQVPRLPDELRRPTTMQSTPIWQAKMVKSIEGFKVPESVLFDAASGMIFVSNIETGDKGYWTADGKGCISTLKADGNIDQLRWRDSTETLKLHAPKGMCILNGNLYTADITGVYVTSFAAEKKPVTKRIEVPGAVHLNDMATDGKDVYVSDTDGDKIYRLDLTDAGKHTTIKSPVNPNGITFWKDAQGNLKMFGVSWKLHEVYELDPAGKEEPKPFGLARHFTNLDGIEVLDDGCFIVSDWTGNKVCTIMPDRQTVRMLIACDSPADIGLDRKTGTLYVPNFMKDKVTVYQLSK